MSDDLRGDSLTPDPSKPPRYMAFVGYFGGTMCFAGIVMGIVLCRWFL